MGAKESYMHKRMSDQVRRMGESTYGTRGWDSDGSEYSS